MYCLIINNYGKSIVIFYLFSVKLCHNSNQNEFHDNICSNINTAISVLFLAFSSSETIQKLRFYTFFFSEEAFLSKLTAIYRT